MKIVVLDGKTLGADVDLTVLGSDLTIYGTTEPEEVSRRIADNETVIVNKVKLNADNLSAAKNLRLICVAATGYDNIDIDYCRKRGIAVCNVCGYSTESVAQLTVTMALSLVTHLNEYTGFVKSGEYTKSGVANRLTPVYHELSGMTWGIVGLGNIGKQVARAAEVFGCRVLAFKRTPDKNYSCVPLSELMEKSDIVSVHLPAGAQTNGIISNEMIGRMKKSAVFVNVARGAVVDEEALVQAVLDNKIAGIGVDVYSKEPFDSEHCYNKIMNMDNVILTPHIAWGAYEARIRCIDEMRRNIEAFEKGEERNRIV
ncbi:MAG: NAD(P)-dependent oxidoreductase [Clostridiales bacterium]|nr:NAD(P)-dependent oxidoreductase [Clostridiales bacterium]